MERDFLLSPWWNILKVVGRLGMVVTTVSVKGTMVLLGCIRAVSISIGSDASMSSRPAVSVMHMMFETCRKGRPLITLVSELGVGDVSDEALSVEEEDDYDWEYREYGLGYDEGVTCAAP